MSEGPTHCVVMNEEEQYSIISVTWPVPPGWTQVGVEGSEDECVAYVDKTWTDMRPRSLREEMDRS